MNRIVGIDLGTTNSSVAVVMDGKPQIIPDGNQRLIPSVVGLSTSDEILVGQVAKNQYVLYPDRTIKSIKTKMGSDEKVRLGKNQYTPQEISAFILKHLKNIASDYLGEQIEKAVITVPAYFSDAQRQATKDAGEIAGLEVVRIINEPTAAALAYGIDREHEQIVMVYDLGGGTFDVSIVELHAGVIEVKASHGNNHLGGDDFDAKIIEFLVDDFLEKYKVDLRDDQKALARITKAAEQAKIFLSDHPYTQIIEEFIAKKTIRSLHLKKELSREQFNKMIDSYIASTLDSIEMAMNDAGMSPRDIYKILMVGGSTRIPLVSEMVADKTGQELHAEIKPDECVALGAAIQGAIIAGEQVDAILVDVTPYSMGIEIADYKFGHFIDDRFSIIIPKNTVIPVSKSEVYYTMHPQQTAVEINVYQGESKSTANNVLLGSFMFENIPKSKDGTNAEFIVQFDFDVDGILHVSAKHKDTERTESIEITTSRIKLSESEKHEAKEKISSIDISEENELTPLIKKAESIQAKLADAHDKEKLQQLIEKSKSALVQNDVKQLEKLKEELLDKMFELEES